MIGFTRAGRRHWLSRLVGIGLVVTGWAVLDSGNVAASPIKGSHHRYEVAVAERAAHSWSAYLLAGPKLWSSVIHPSVTPEVRASIWHALRTDADESNPWVHFLLWKQSLNPDSVCSLPSPRCAGAQSDFRRPGHHARHRCDLTAQHQHAFDPATDPDPRACQSPGRGSWLLGMTGWGLWWRRRQR